jgi:hypothetical protein
METSQFNLTCAEINESLVFTQHFSLSKGNGNVPRALLGYTDKRPYYLSAKQIPSACSLRSGGSSSVKLKEDLLRDSGFPISEISENGKPLRYTLPMEEYLEVDPEELVSSYPGSQVEETESVPSTPIASPPNEKEEATSIPYEKTHKRIDYDDPWLIISGYTYCSLKGEPLPEIKMWFGDVIRIQDPIPPRMLGPEWSGSKKNKIRFNAIADAKIKVSFILHHTHWGFFLSNSVRAQDTSDSMRKWCLFQIKRLKAYLNGKSDPRWTKSFKDQVNMKPVTGDMLKTRATRLIEVLKTVDGMFVQRYLTFPNEVWTWKKYDLFILRNLFELLSDEFLDGEINSFTASLTTRYEELKQARGIFKKKAHMGDLPETFREDLNLPEWLHQLQPIWAEVMNIKDTYQRIARIGILSQTRGCGTPPALAVLHTKEKFLKVVTEPTPPLPNWKKRAVFFIAEQVIKDIPDEAFTGLSTKARVTVTSAACLEYTQADGGSVQAIADIVALGQLDYPASKFNLETGEYEGDILLSECQPGEYIFWRCLEIVLGKQRSELEKVQLVAVKEPGKSRIVTKGPIAVKVILDVVNKICSEPLKKGVESSQSGMGKSHHGWNFFKSLFDEERKELIFRVTKIVDHKDETTPSTFIREKEYEAVYVSSTDYETATDYMNLEIASILGNLWMSRCGIPKILRNIVHQFCFRPRTILFHGTGVLTSYGIEALGGENLRQVSLSRGIMMGDPLTKVILHLLNVSVRSFSLNFDKKEYLRKVFPQSYETVKENIDILLGNLKEYQGPADAIY